MLKNDFTNFAIFEEVVHNFSRSDDDMMPNLIKKILDGLHKGPPFWCFCAHIMYEVDT